ncbi:MAG: tetratricopeptide repeat protein [Fulvivirga sp.]
MIQKISIQLNLYANIIIKLSGCLTSFQYKRFVISNQLFTLIIVSTLINTSQATAQDSVDKLFNRAYHYLSVDRQKAISLLSDCINQDAEFTDAYFHRGIAYFKEGKYDSALHDFKTVERQNPDRSIIWMYKGFTYRNQGNIEEALASFSNYISLNPTDTSAYSYILRGKVKYELGDFQGAVSDYDMAMKLQPFEEKYQYYRFVALFEAKQFKQALEAVDRLIEINDDFYGYYFYKGNVYLEMNDFDNAIYMYNVAILKNYNNADSYYKRATAYLALDKYDKALEDYNTAIVLKPNDGTFYSHRGNCKFEMGKKSAACADWNEAGALGYYEDFDKMKQVCQGLNSTSDNEGK